MESKHLTWVEIEKEALRHNLALFKKVIGPKILLMTVIKSNAYGHGLLGTAEIVSNFGIDYLGVVNLEEALFLRYHHILTPILVLSYFETDKIDEAIKNNIELTVYDLTTARLISVSAQKLKTPARIHLKIDTGTSRLGILTKEATDFINDICRLKGIEVIGLFTHFADSENDDWTFTHKQIWEFKNLLFSLQKLNIKIPLAHAACSAATLVSAETHFDLVRIGLALYGLWPSPGNKKKVTKKYPWFSLKPALTWKTRIIQIKKLAKGVNVGYGLTYRTKKKMTLAVLPVGYHEGYSRLLSNKGEVLIRGKKMPIIGRVCMNLTMVDITNVPEAEKGDEVVLLGKQEDNEITAEEIAEKIKTINYEVVTGINPLLPREYL